MGGIWGTVASDGAALCVGVAIGLGATGINFKRHGDIARAGLVFMPALIAGATFYTFVVCVVGQLLFKVPLHELVQSFGDGRLAWLLIYAAAESFIRLYRLTK